MESNVFRVCFFQVKSSDFLSQQKQHLGISSGTWVPGLQVCITDFSPSYFKGLEFLFLSSYRACRPSALADTEGSRPASLVRWGNAKRRAVLPLPGLAFWSEVRGAERETGKTITNEKEPQQGALCQPNRSPS